MMDNDAKLRGWKMYPARTNYQTFFEVDENQQENTNPAIPLGAGSKFKLHIRFHNLKGIELGALLYAITLQKNSCHTLGFGKAFGYGVCKYCISDVKGFNIDDVEIIISQFINYMESKVDNYAKTPQIKEFLIMANPSQAERLRRPLAYMELEEFVSCKKHNPRKNVYGEFLPRYSELLRPIVQTQSSPKQSIAEVTIFSGGMKKAKLVDGKDIVSKILDMNNKKEKLKLGDKIEVEIIKNGKELRFIKKI